LAAVANRLCRTPRPIIRTRHIVQAVRPHAGNRWLYRQATALVVTVTNAIREQYLASGLLPANRVVALPGGADIEAYHARPGTPPRRWPLLTSRSACRSSPRGCRGSCSSIWPRLDR